LQGATAAGQQVGTGIAGAGEAIKAAGGVTSALPGGGAPGIAGAGVGGGGGTTALDIGGRAAGQATKGLDLASKIGPTQVGEKGHWLSQAIKAGTDFAKSPAGAKLIEGFGGGAYREEELDKLMAFSDRYRRAWADPSNPIQQMIGQGGAFDIDVPEGYLGRRVQNPATIREAFEPTVPFSRGG